MKIVVGAAPIVVTPSVVVQSRPAPAFQANAFQNNAYQTTSFSQIAFQQCAFQDTAFQTDPCVNDGRSGYWRLFFTQMQEEALKKRDEKKEPAEVVGTVTEIKTDKRTKVRKPAAPPKPAKVEKPLPVIPFRKLPTKLEPTAFDELAKLPPLALETYARHLSGVIINLATEKEKRKKHRRKLAAFLLMAA